MLTEAITTTTPLLYRGKILQVLWNRETDQDFKEIECPSRQRVAGEKHRDRNLNQACPE